MQPKEWSAPRDRLRHLFVFEIAEEGFAINLESVREVLPVSLLSHPPGTPPILQGFLNLGGEAIPVLSPKRLFQLKDSPPAAYSHLIILKRAETPLAILVDRAVGTAKTAQSSLMPVGQDHSFNDCVEHDVRIGTQTVHVLSIERLLIKEEESRIAQLHSMEQTRLHQLEETSS